MSTLIDYDARKRLALLARRLGSGRISNRDFEHALQSSREAALHDICFYGLWPLYDDSVQHKLIGRWALTKEGKSFVARLVLFLRSGMPYRYPRLTGFSAAPVLLLSVLTLGWFGRMWRRCLWAQGDESVWPFFSRAELEDACRHPVYLGGSVTNEILPSDQPQTDGR